MAFPPPPGGQPTPSAPRAPPTPALVSPSTPSSRSNLSGGRSAADFRAVPPRHHRGVLYLDIGSADDSLTAAQQPPSPGGPGAPVPIRSRERRGNGAERGQHLRFLIYRIRDELACARGFQAVDQRSRGWEAK